MITTLIAASSLLSAGLVAAPPNTVPMLKINHVAQIDNVDKMDALNPDRADFFASVTINGRRYKTKVMSQDDGMPNWKFPLDTTKRFNRITLSIWDDDGGLERKDDHIDISPRHDQKNLRFTYDRYTGRISGDVRGVFGKPIVSRGRGDSDKAEIEFCIVK